MTLVYAKRTIEQSPLTDSPAIPKGTRGEIEDTDQTDGMLIVDFGAKYGHVLCLPEEIRTARLSEVI